MRWDKTPVEGVLEEDVLWGLDVLAETNDGRACGVSCLTGDSPSLRSGVRQTSDLVKT